MVYVSSPKIDQVSQILNMPHDSVNKSAISTSCQLLKRNLCLVPQPHSQLINSLVIAIEVLLLVGAFSL